jgi:hypothetical protein
MVPVTGQSAIENGTKGLPIRLGISELKLLGIRNSRRSDR